MNIGKEKVVSIHYSLRNDEGETLDSSEGGEPLTYIQGMGNLIPGLEAALEGKTAGDSIKASIPPAEAYGEFSQALISQVPRSQFSGVDDLQAGMQFHAPGADGHHLVTITKVENDMVTVDGNHPLAGMTLHFDVTVVDIREATKDELEHGHVHGPGGHHHH
jgi:FKBP-type peptidyl-prolyl cis-trans isomerase SlyD